MFNPIIVLLISLLALSKLGVTDHHKDEDTVDALSHHHHHSHPDGDKVHAHPLFNTSHVEIHATKKLISDEKSSLPINKKVETAKIIKTLKQESKNKTKSGL
ncbi:unnamed protein product [Gordionus sp. m RMFG-2023]